MKKIIIFGLLLIGLFLVSCSSEVDNTSCTFDNDCVPATCCHPAAAVNQENAPACGVTICTQECVPETTDCGQGEIKCVSNKCAIILK